jgi:fluoride ion exporter CrcB/FEX
MNIKNVLVFTFLTILIPLAAQLVLFQYPIPSYQFANPIRLIIYFATGFIGAALTLSTFKLTDATIGTIIGILIYPIDTIPFLISDPLSIMPDIILRTTATILGAYTGSKTLHPRPKK